MKSYDVLLFLLSEIYSIFPRENNFISLFSIFKNHHDILIKINIISIKTFVKWINKFFSIWLYTHIYTLLILKIVEIYKKDYNRDK